MLNEGDRASVFSLSGLSPSGEEKDFSLGDFLNQGKIVILYFYPKDNTPGCTTEACDFRDNINRLTSKCIVVGVSPDSVGSHKKFKENHLLNFYLLSDSEKNVMKNYGAYGEKKMYGKTIEGVIRTTYAINPDGTILKIWRNVKARGHVDKIINDLNL